MGLLDLFRRKPPIADLAGLADFLDSRAAFLTQKCVWEYSRARAGPHWQALFRDAEFQVAVTRACWTNYPLMLGAVAECAEGILRPHAGDHRADLVEGLIATARAVTRRHPQPDGLPSDFWPHAAERIAERLRRAGLAAPKPAHLIPMRSMGRFLAAMPIHPELRNPDNEGIANNLRVGLCHVHDLFARRADGPALAAALIAAGAGSAAAATA